MWSTELNQIRNQLILILLTHTHTHTHIYIYIYIGLWVIRHNLRPKIVTLKVTFLNLYIIYLNFNIIVFFVYLKSILLNFLDTKLLIKILVSNISLLII